LASIPETKFPANRSRAKKRSRETENAGRPEPPRIPGPYSEKISFRTKQADKPIRQTAGAGFAGAGSAAAGGHCADPADFAGSVASAGLAGSADLVGPAGLADVDWPFVLSSSHPLWK